MAINRREAATTLSHGAHQSDLCRDPRDLLWHLVRSLEAEVIGLCVAMVMQLSERNISGFIAFLVTSIRLPHLDWNRMQDHYEVEYHKEPLNFARAIRLMRTQTGAPPHPDNSKKRAEAAACQRKDMRPTIVGSVGGNRTWLTAL
jgi:hypothetical protein